MIHILTDGELTILMVFAYLCGILFTCLLVKVVNWK